MTNYRAHTPGGCRTVDLDGVPQLPDDVARLMKRGENDLTADQEHRAAVAIDAAQREIQKRLYLLQRTGPVLAGLEDESE